MSKLHFDFSGSTIKTDAELDAADGRTKKEDTSKTFKPGKYDAVIESVTMEGPAKDPNWAKIKLVIKGAGVKSTYDWVMVPLTNVMYQAAPDKKPTAYMFRRIKDFAAALGVKLSPANLAEGLRNLLGKEGEALVGKNIGILIGYDRAYVNYAGKDAAGLATFKVTFPARNGQVETDLAGPDGSVLKFADREAARQHCEETGIQLDNFPKVLKYTESSVKNVSNSNW